MKIIDIGRTALRGIGRNKLRSLLMMTGVTVGVAAMTTVTALGESASQDVMDKLASSFGAHNIFISAGGGARHGAARGDGPTTTLTLEDIRAIQAEIPNVSQVGPSIGPGDKMVSYNGINKEVRITGHGIDAEFLFRPATSGSFFAKADLESAARVAIIGTDVASEFFGIADPIGEQLRIGTIPFEVIGILEEGGVDMHGINRDNEIFVPVTTAMRRLMNVDYVSSVKLRVRDETQMASSAASIERLLRKRHQLGTDTVNDFGMITPVQVQEMVDEGQRTMTVFMPLISGISILVGALIIASLMLVAVNERRPEIGLRKAVGARPRDIQVQFLLEAALITAVAGIAGLVLGALVSQVLLRLDQKPPILPWNTMLIGFGASVLAGLLAGVLPARRASLLDPVETLR